MNFLEFYIEADCTVRIEPRNVIHGMVRLQWTMEEFWQKGGVTRFIDRLSSALGIHRSRVKTLDIYTGSVVVDFMIEGEYQDEDDADKSKKELSQLLETLKDVITNNVVDFGAPVLGLEGDGELLFGTPIPKNPTATANASTAIRKDDNIWDRFVRI